MSLFRIAMMLPHGTSGAAARNSSGSRFAASPSSSISRSADRVKNYVGTEVFWLPGWQQGPGFGNEIEHFAQRDLRVMSAHKSGLPPRSPRRESTC